MTKKIRDLSAVNRVTGISKDVQKGAVEKLRQHGHILKKHNINLQDTWVNLSGKLKGATLEDLDALCRALRHLPSLEGLCLSSSQLKALPDGLGNLPNLQYLDIGFNQLETARRLGNLHNLQRLTIRGNKFAHSTTRVLATYPISKNCILRVPESHRHVRKFQ